MVVAIIGILASLLLSALSRDKSAAHKTVCLNNQRQIGIARQLYANDNDGVLVVGEFWNSLLSFSYLDGQTNLFNCPSEKRVLKFLRAAGRLEDPPTPPWRDSRYGHPFIPWGYQQNDLGLRPDGENWWWVLGRLYGLGDDLVGFGSLRWFRLRG